MNNDFTAENAKNLRIHRDISWESLSSLKELIQSRAKYDDYVIIRYPDYHNGFSVEQVQSFLKKKGFDVKVDSQCVYDTDIPWSNSVKTDITISWLN